MMVIGITGQFCSGKSTAAKMFAALGAKVIDADEIGRDILSNRTVKKRLIDYFGKNIVAGSGKINRKQLAARAFTDKRSHKALCRIVHPALSRAIIDKIKRFKAQSPQEVVVVDAAVLIEMGLLKYIDKLAFVYASNSEQIKRAKLKWGLAKTDIDRRIHLQLPVSRLIKKADFIIDNSGSLKQTKKQVEKIWGGIWQMNVWK